MVGTIIHTTQVVAANDPSYEVSKNAWNEVHTITPYTISQILSDHNEAAHNWETTGTFTIYANTTSRVVNHGLSGTPKVLLQNKTNFANLKVTNETATQFTAVIEAPQSTDTEVNYYASL